MRITKETVFNQKFHKRKSIDIIKKHDRQDVLSQVEFSGADLIILSNNIFNNPTIPDTSVSRTEVKIMKMDKVKWELIEMVSEGKLDDYPHLKQLHDILKEEI